MSLTKKKELIEIAKIRCRDLRKNQTKAEQILWDILRNRKFFNKKFYRQYPIFFDFLGRETFYIADFYNHENRLVIEIDGKIHEHQKEHDELRTNIINSLGLNVIRFKNKEIESDIESVLSKLKKHLKGTN